MSDALGRINVLRLMIAISMIAMPVLYLVGSNVTFLYVMVFIVYWCYGTQLSVNGCDHCRLLGHQERGYQLRNVVHGVGRGRTYRSPESVVFCSTSTTTTRWRSIPQEFWRRWRWYPS